MTDRLDLLSQQLLHKEISVCSVEELQQFSQQYPFFAPAQLLLLKKLKQVNDPLYSQQLQKAALYHHNPMALDFLVNAREYQTVFPEEQIIEPANALNEESPVLIEQPQEVDTEEVKAPIKEEITEPLVSEPSEIEAPAIETSAIEIMEVVEVQKLSDLAPKVDEEIQVQPTTEVSEKVPLEEIPQAQSFSNKDLTFEPFHTVDYFASQGIKLSQEEVAKDNFGRQLKSFTDWLKTMKRLPAAEQLKKLDPHAEEKVENIATHSLDNAEILTEAMAEVWVKQGKLEKAIEVYNKLSLINPSKRAYFATKLENLKKAI